MRRIIIGTSYFVSERAAIRYYKPYGFDAAAVRQKLADGEIHVGIPELKPGETLNTVPGEGRYQIECEDRAQ